MDSGQKVYCITGIDTDIGKTIATGIIARCLAEKGLRIITQKIVQTGGDGISEDILRHRQIMGMPLTDSDRQGLTCPYVFAHPCSPHLAAQLAGERIDCDRITEATQELCRQYDIVLLEGAGGLLVPLTGDLTLLDYLQRMGYPLILVSSCRLGSINHTLSALELAKARGLTVAAIIYNLHGACDARILDDSREIMARYMGKHGFSGPLIDLEEWTGDGSGIDCEQIRFVGGR